MKIIFSFLVVFFNLISLHAQAPYPQPAYETDVGLTMRVSRVLLNDTTFSKYFIDVQTIYGVVTLLGEVDSEAVKNAIGEKVRGINGVKAVNNRITIARNSMN